MWLSRNTKVIVNRSLSLAKIEIDSKIFSENTAQKSKILDSE